MNVVEQVIAEKLARYGKTCAHCGTFGVPQSGDTDPNTGQVVHFCTNHHRTLWVAANQIPRLPFGMNPVFGTIAAPSNH